MDDQSLLEAVNELEDDLALVETADTLQRQLAFQEQMGGNVAAQPESDDPITHKHIFYAHAYKVSCEFMFIEFDWATYIGYLGSRDGAVVKVLASH